MGFHKITELDLILTFKGIRDVQFLVLAERFEIEL